MNFFESQDRAKRNTSWLVLMFVFALLGLVTLLYAGVHWLMLGQPPSPTTLDKPLLVDVAVGVLALVSIGSIYKIIALNTGGGEAVAQSMGGRLVLPSTDHPEERRLLNIVGEMALAVGCPVPQVYLIPDTSVNAFAAGTKPGNAVIGVTAGALSTFSRDEMQGVIAHEFSHIINGDMRLSMRLIGIIHGIMLLSYLGYFLLRSSFFLSMSRSSSREGGAAAMAIPAAGLALIVIGAVGAFFGGLIRAAVSRQREFLADASAVQFTRNPDGIGGALQKIGVRSGMLKNPKAAEVAHMFFAKGAGMSFSGLMATHPPLNERIQRIVPQWDGTSAIGTGLDKLPVASPDVITTHAAAANFSSNLASTQQGTAQQATPPDLFAMLFGKNEKATQLTTQAGKTHAAALTAASCVIDNLSPILQTALSDSYSTRALVYAMLLDRNNEGCRRTQCEHLHNFADAGVYKLTMRLEPEIVRLSRAVCLPLLLRTPPALRLMSPVQYERFANNVLALISADAAVDLFEWSVEAVLLHHLQDYFGRVKKESLPTTQEAMTYALSMLAQAGHSQTAATAFATAQQGLNLRFSDEAFSPEKLSLSMRRLNTMPSQQKARFLQSAANCAAHDGVINSDEGELLRAYAALLDCPLPPVSEASLS
ncbi:M48 family metallopeptidase [Candidatus Persebacteraceae bacterium Df01]|jgi:Zn-dependent protease with chaperone function|uniref:M48 family metallopeptidase n=1 Tax=Candidatus Doriopsillibacter californiensis TaxID=2970740 RepID=A0ABT7QMP4_9GAMM|nr:M48 family metallopeptidase [Candidatus Persebacteraceae bacterium Df01]